jgi:predicted secreted protein
LDRLGSKGAGVVVRAPLAALLAALALLAGCDDEGDGIVFKDPREPIRVERGMEFTLELTVNAGVGIEWVPVTPPLDGPVVLKSTKVVSPEGNRDGDSGKKRLVYEAKRAGTQTIELHRLFRGDRQERRRIRVTVSG